MEGIIWTGGIR